MTTFTLVVRPDGQAILTTRQQFTAEAAERIRDAWREWLDRRTDVVFIPDCEVVQVVEVELDLEALRSEEASL